MSRSLIASLAAVLVLSSAATVTAQEPGRITQQVQLVSASAPVLDSWAYERPSSSPALKTLLASYGVLQGLDIYSTSVARRAGAREANPLMNTGMVQATAVKAVMGLTTYYAVNRMSKNNRKAAVVTMMVLNGVTAAVVANNMKNSRR